MRTLALFGACVLTIVVAAQKPPILSSRPDVYVEVKKSQVGPDYVTVKMVEPDYPPALLQKQCEAVGRYLGTQIRGLDLQALPTGTSGKGGGAIISAEFAADGVINRATGTLELNAFAKAFCGVPEPNTVDCLAVIFMNEVPKEGSTLKSWSGDAVSVAANFDPTAPMVEYRITLSSQNPDQIHIPATINEQTKQAQKPSNDKPQTSLLPWVIGAAVLVGVLVYFALRPRPSGTPRGRAER